MATKHDVRVTEAHASAARYRVTCACTCGWTERAQAPDEPRALAEAARTRVDHLVEAHPRQQPSAFFRPRAHARYRHPRSISVATQHGRHWSRHVACACGWTDVVRAGSLPASTRSAKARHKAHMQLQTGRTPVRDYAVMLAVVLVVAGVLLVIAVTAIQASGGDPKDLTDLGELLG